MERQFEYMSEQFEKNGFFFSDEQKKQFLLFYEMLIEKNSVMNLTRITEFEETVEKHFLDSLSAHSIFDFHKKIRILDLGTGAGFPGIPLKIAFPQIEITLLDSSKKKIDFVNSVIKEISLSDISAIHGRAEDFARNPHFREQFNLCVCRAVANLSVLIEYAIPFLRIGGTMISYKSGEIEEEAGQSAAACRRLGAKVKQIHKFELGDNRRSFVVIKKEKATPGRYPRRAGVPSHSPL